MRIPTVLNDVYKRAATAVCSTDRWLLVALILAFIFTFQGINWGRVEDWNPDELALRSLKRTLEPGNFEKPPFHEYLNRVLVLSWVTEAEQIVQRWERIEQSLSGHKPAGKEEKVVFNAAALLGCRFLTLGLFLGSVSLEFAISRRFFGVAAARMTALVMATSAGFIAANHFLTADSPMIFWMLLALFFCQRIMESEALENYLLAGLITGIATATKYNALGVGLAIPMAHLLKSTSIKGAVLDRRTVFGVLMVPVGFILGCPYAILDHKKFVSDFMYNYTVTPHYGGNMTGHSYGDFLVRITQIIGWPGAILAALMVAGGLILIVLRKTPAASIKGFLLVASVFALYYFKIGSFSRMETRFVLPIVPLLLMLMGPCLEFCAGYPAYILLTPVLIYNCICSMYVGFRFADDPRMAAQTWVETHLAAGTSIESTQHVPKFNKLPGMNLDIRNAPNSNGRGVLFSQIFGNNKWVSSGQITDKEGEVNDADFTLEALEKRNPEYVALDSNAYRGAVDEVVKTYFASLLNGSYPYQIVFDLETAPSPGWLYPKDIDFLNNRITILKRVGGKE